ncbi:hypothetical protein EG68_08941 [Paragonimus skrjabini miyazakii]|uniref:Uncharacterized protein n=1 Tax=Paragonimus skrjabini miyazakii TaxID=59628 RepID=A0A8S9YIY6_9TREM|nr:hypothetical protein EG68_08941 [Paragonimus skrjabini miyazakii]
MSDLSSVLLRAQDLLGKRLKDELQGKPLQYFNNPKLIVKNGRTSSSHTYDIDYQSPHSEHTNRIKDNLMDQTAMNNAVATNYSQTAHSTQPVFIQNHTAMNKRPPTAAGLCNTSSSSSKWKFTGCQLDDAIQEYTVSYDGATKQQRVVAQFEKDQNEICRLQKSLASCQAEMGELLIDANRKKALVATLTKESAAKDSMLKQLDTALGRLTVEWKAREEQRQLELSRIKQSEQKSAEQLEEARRQFESSKNDLESRLEGHREEILKTFETTDAERIRQETAIRELKQKLTEALHRVNESEQLTANRESELEEVRKQLAVEKEKKRQLIAHCSQLQEEWKRQLTEAQSSLRREARLQKIELKKLKNEMEKTITFHEQENNVLRTKMAEEFENRMHKTLAEKETQHQTEIMKIKEGSLIALREASDRYRTELEQLRLNAQIEVSRQINEAEKRSETERLRVEASDRQAERWRLAAGEAENARSMLASRINDLLQSRCTEAMQILHPTNINRPIKQDSKTVTEIPIEVTLQQVPANALKGLKAVYINQANPRYPEEDTTQSVTTNGKAKDILTIKTVSDEEESCSTDYSVVTEIHTAQYLQNSIADTEEGGVTAEKDQSFAGSTTVQRSESLFSMVEALD